LDYVVSLELFKIFSSFYLVDVWAAAFVVPIVPAVWGANVVDGVGNANSVEAVLLVAETSGDVWVPFSSAPEAISSKP
jgi:hypothetical protein